MVSSSGRAVVSSSGRAVVSSSGRAVESSSGRAVVSSGGRAVVSSSGGAVVSSSCTVPDMFDREVPELLASLLFISHSWLLCFKCRSGGKPGCR